MLVPGELGGSEMMSASCRVLCEAASPGVSQEGQWPCGVLVVGDGQLKGASGRRWAAGACAQALTDREEFFFLCGVSGHHTGVLGASGHSTYISHNYEQCSQGAGESHQAS